MGQCGCSDTAPDFKFPGPDGVTYAIQIYPSCHYCSSPAGVDIHRFNDEWTREWCDGVPDAPWLTYAHGDPANAILSIPVLDPKHLMKALGEPGDDEYADIDEEEMRLALPDAVHETLQEFYARVKGAS